MRETNKFWAKNDEMKLSDVKSDFGPVDPFKNTYTKKMLKNEITDKV